MKRQCIARGTSKKKKVSDDEALEFTKTLKRSEHAKEVTCPDLNLLTVIII